MKVLCPIDFSKSSINACKWIASFLDQSDQGSIHLSHFIYMKRRASMFISMDKVLVERAEEDMMALIDELNSVTENVTYTYSMYMSHPKEGIVYVAEKDDFDLIVTGSTGLTALRDITLGSVTHHLISYGKIPVLAIPDKVAFTGGKKIAFAVDDKMVKKLDSLDMLRDFCKSNHASLDVIHVTEDFESPFEYDPGIDIYFSDMEFEYKRLEKDGTLVETINHYCDHENVDILSMLHHKRSWFGQLFNKSVTKSELFNLEVPLLILNEV